MINILLLRLDFLPNIKVVFYFLPIFAFCFIITIFWGFLYLGYKRLDELRYYYFILLNIMIINCFILAIFLKLEFTMDSISWMSLLGSFCSVCTLNFLILSHVTFVKKEKNIYRSQDSMFIVIDILLIMCFLCFTVMLGLYLDNKIRGIKVIPLYIMVWFFNTLIIIKLIVKNTTITNFFEWKKMVIC